MHKLYLPCVKKKKMLCEPSLKLTFRACREGTQSSSDSAQYNVQYTSIKHLNLLPLGFSFTLC